MDAALDDEHYNRYKTWRQAKDITHCGMAILEWMLMDVEDSYKTRGSRENKRQPAAQSHISMEQGMAALEWELMGRLSSKV